MRRPCPRSPNGSSPHQRSKTVLNHVLSLCKRTSRAVIRVFFAPPTPQSLIFSLRHRQKDHLPVPAIDKNFLISPPGSPPVGWEQIREEAPNRETLAQDLIAALQGLAFDDKDSEQEQSFTLTSADLELSASVSSPASSSRPSNTSTPGGTRCDMLLIPPSSPPGSVSVPGVIVSDMEPESNVSDQQRLPSGGINRVRATVAAMRGGGMDPQPRITPTGRPPLAGI
jgi:Calcipressin